ncbi:MAG: Holliday junction resolvase RuvX [Actinomycetota bacterium]|nr:Holliday junction resolvase RuvX [Actinomycetota bacterium]
MARIIALDIGEKRVGVAYCSTVALVAMPVDAFVVNKSLVDELDRLLAHVSDYSPDLFVVGDPIALSGRASVASEKVHAIADQLAAKSGVEVKFVDERLTSRTATNRARASGQRLSRASGALDSIAAGLILEGYLDTIS